MTRKPLVRIGVDSRLFDRDAVKQLLPVCRPVVVRRHGCVDLVRLLRRVVIVQPEKSPQSCRRVWAACEAGRGQDLVDVSAEQPHKPTGVIASRAVPPVRDAKRCTQTQRLEGALPARDALARGGEGGV